MLTLRLLLCGRLCDLVRWFGRCGKNFRRILAEIEAMREEQARAAAARPAANSTPRKTSSATSRAKPLLAPRAPIRVSELVLWYYSEWKVASGYGSWKASMLSTNIDVCVVCDGGGVLLCCDACPDAYHLTCMDPPMLPSDVPEDEWCVHAAHSILPASCGHLARSARVCIFVCH